MINFLVCLFNNLKFKKINLFHNLFRFLSILYLLTNQFIFAQNIDSLLIIAKENAINIYKSSISQNSSIYNGKEDRQTDSKSKGHPYFGNQAWLLGDVIYNENIYKNIYLKYNTVSQQLILQHWGGFLKIELVKSKIKSFTILGQAFLNINSDSTSKIESGFYKQLYSENLLFLSKINKIKSESVIESEIITEFKEIKDYFLLKENNTFKIKSLSSFESVFPNKDIKKICNDLKLDFKKDEENSYVKLLKFCTIEN